MARHRSSYEHPGDDDMNEIIGNGSLSEHYLALARDLDVTEAKVGLKLLCVHSRSLLPASFSSVQWFK